MMCGRCNSRTCLKTSARLFRTTSLVPGIGAQGGSLEEVCKYGMNKECGLIVNSSRAIIYADKTERFAEVAGEEAHKVQQQMAEQLKAIL